MRAAAISLAALAVTVESPTPAQAASGIAVEGVNDYSYIVGDHSQDTHCAWSACGFYATMISGTAPTNFSTCETTSWSGSTGWSAAHTPWYDNSVYDTDFVDPDASGHSYDTDGAGFDKLGTHITYVALHGTCGDVTANICGGAFFCTSGYCSTGSPQPSGLTQACIVETPRQLVTSSTFDQHGHLLSYGRNSGGSEVGDIRIGEDSNSGSWAGAGTNGGANVAVIVNSCGARGPYLWDDLRGMYAGVHAIMIAAPAGAWVDGSGNVFASDTADRAARGANLATLILANPLSAMSSAWSNATLMAFGPASLSGAPVPSGMTGLGAHVTQARDSTSSTASWHVHNESWLGSMSDSNDAVGATYGSVTYACNYDCATYGLY